MTDEQIIKALECCSTDVRENTCPKCAFYKKHRCSTLMLNAVSDLIIRQKAEIERLLQKLQQAKSEAIKEFAEELKESADTNNAETKHGQWKIEEYKNHLNVVCSNCNKEFYVYKQGQYRIDRSNYCPNCGAKMGKGQGC